MENVLFFFVCLIDTSNEIKSGKARRHGKVGFDVSDLIDWKFELKLDQMTLKFSYLKFKNENVHCLK